MRVEFHPAPVDSGLVFVRRDMQPARRVAAVIANRIEAPRRTTLVADGATVEMVEHIMAALWGLKIDNCEISVDAPEMPGCDGSSLAYVEALTGAGIVEQAAPQRRLLITETTRVGGDDAWVIAVPPVGDHLEIKYHLDYGRPSPIGRQTIQLTVTPQSLRRELAPARTFILEHEAQWLQQRGLGARATFRDLLVFGESGPLDNELRYADECVRHKALDLIGDLALCGCDLIGSVSAHRSGHRLKRRPGKSPAGRGASRRTASKVCLIAGLSGANGERNKHGFIRRPPCNRRSAGKNRPRCRDRPLLRDRARRGDRRRYATGKQRHPDGPCDGRPAQPHLSRRRRGGRAARHQLPRRRYRSGYRRSQHHSRKCHDQSRQRKRRRCNIAGQQLLFDGLLTCRPRLQSWR